MIKNSVIVALICLLVWFGASIIRLEKYHYAASLGMCGELENKLDRIRREECLENAETRTSPIWHLVYGLRIL